MRYRIFIQTINDFVLLVKIRIRLAFLFLLLVLLAVSGCTTMNDAEQGRGSGEKVTYQASFDEVWAAIPQAINAADLHFVSADRKNCMVLAKQGMTAWSYGENIAVFVDKIGETQTIVEVVSRRMMETNILAKDVGVPIFEQLDKKLKRA